jgi:hypothetical protein
MPKVKSYSAIDKIEPIIESLKKKYPQGKFISGNIPPFQFLRITALIALLVFR